MTCEKCVGAISSALSNVEGIENFEISLEKGSVIVQTSLPSNTIKEKIETTGRRAILKGYGFEPGWILSPRKKKKLIYTILEKIINKRTTYIY